MIPKYSLILVFLFAFISNVIASADNSTDDLQFGNMGYGAAQSWCKSRCEEFLLYLTLNDACSCISDDTAITEDELIEWIQALQNVTDGCSKRFTNWADEHECVQIEGLQAFQMGIQLLEKNGNIMDIPKELLPSSNIHWRIVKNIQSEREWRELRVKPQLQDSSKTVILDARGSWLILISLYSILVFC